MRTNTSTRRRFVSAVVTTAVTGFAGCATSSDSSQSKQTSTTSQGGVTSTKSTTTTTEESETTAETTVESAAEVEMITDNQGSYFDPKGLLVDAGTTVRFVNTSGSHATAAYHPDNADHPLRIPKEAEPWDSSTFTAKNKTFEVTLEKKGVYDYYCAPHETLGMVGRIIVGRPNGGPGTSPSDDLPPAARETLPKVETIMEKKTVKGP